MVWLSSWQIPFLFTSAEEVKEEEWGDAVLYTAQCLGTESVGFTLVCTSLPFHLPFSLPYYILPHFLEPIISPFYVSLI